MENVKAFLNDKKNQPIIIGVFIIVLLVVGFAYYMLMFAGGGEQTESADFNPPPTQPVPPPGGAPGGVPEQGPSPAPAPSAPEGVPAGTPSASAGAPGQQVAKAEPPIENYRIDPFAPYLGPKPKRTRVTFMAKLPKPDIRRIRPVIPGADKGLAASLDILPPQPQRRMAGLMKNGQIYAIIETMGQGGSSTSTVVRPGMELEGGMKVDRILPDKVVLRSTGTRRPIFIDVPRSSSPLVPVTSSSSGEGSAPKPGGGGRGGMPPPTTEGLNPMMGGGRKPR